MKLREIKKATFDEFYQNIYNCETIFHSWKSSAVNLQRSWFYTAFKTLMDILYLKEDPYAILNNINVGEQIV